VQSRKVHIVMVPLEVTLSLSLSSQRFCLPHDLLFCVCLSSLMNSSVSAIQKTRGGACFRQRKYAKAANANLHGRTSLVPHAPVGKNARAFLCRDIQVKLAKHIYIS
jgi:hypothetical protein